MLDAFPLSASFVDPNPKEHYLSLSPDEPVTHGQFQTFQSRLFDYLERQFRRIDQRVEAMVSRFDQLEARIDALCRRFDRLEAKYGERSTRMSGEVSRR